MRRKIIFLLFFILSTNLYAKFVVSINYSDNFYDFEKSMIRAVRTVPDMIIVKNVKDPDKLQDWIQKIGGEIPADLDINIIPLIFGGVYSISLKCYSDNTCVINIFNSIIGGDKTEITYPRIREYEEKLYEILSDFPYYHDAVTYEKSIYNWVIDNVNIDKNDVLTARNSAYSALIWGYSLCDGYASLLTSLLQGNGFESRLVTGEVTLDNESWTGHAWSAVKICGKWHYLDAVLDENFKNNFRFFNLSSSEIENSEIVKHKCITNCVNAVKWDRNSCEKNLECSIRNLNLCNEFECYRMGFYWDEDKCTKKPSIPADVKVISWDYEHLYFAKNQDECFFSDGYWYNNSCHQTPLADCEQGECTLGNPPYIMESYSEDIFIDPVKKRIEVPPGRVLIMPALSIDLLDDFESPIVYIYFPEKKFGLFLDNVKYKIFGDVIYYYIGEVDLSTLKGLRVYIYVGYKSIFGNILYNGYELFVN